MRTRIGAGLVAVLLVVVALSIARSLRAGVHPATTAQLDRQTAVIGMTVGAQSRAYPLQALGAEVIDEELGGQPIVVTF